MSDTRSVTSADGTTSAFEVTGTGPAVVVVASALADRSDARRLAAVLAPRFTVINYDRRGRGASGDTQPYAVEREVEDIAALIAEAGGSASVFGSSSGAVLALEAASCGLPVDRLALYEPPLVVSDDEPGPPADLARRVTELIAANRRGQAVTYFMTRAIGVPTVLAHMMRLMPRTWSNMKAMAPTIPYDLALTAEHQTGRPPQPARWASVKAPTLIMSGSKSPAYLRRGAASLADALPDARHQTLDGLSHSAVVMKPKVIAQAVGEFFSGTADS